MTTWGKTGNMLCNYLGVGRANFRVTLNPYNTKINNGGLMVNLTITIDEATLKKARIRAIEQNTSVNRILR